MPDGRALVTRIVHWLALPVLMKEMRSRMRGMRTPLMLLVCTGLACAVAVVVLWFSCAEHDRHPYAFRTAEIGQVLFATVVVLEGFFCILITPSLTSGAITSEREQQTLEMLLLTRLSTANILLGKLLSALSLVAIILLCVLPVEAIAFFLGGVSPMQVAWSIGLIFAASLCSGAIGLYFSTCMQKTRMATTFSHATCLGWVLLVPALTIFMPVTVYQSSSYGFSPFYLFISLLLTVVLTLPLIGIVCLPITLLLRRPPSRLLFILLWVIAIIFLTAINLNEPIAVRSFMNNYPECYLLGNPLIALMIVVSGDSPFTANTVLAHNFVPLTFGLLLLYTGVLLVFAVREFHRLRRWMLA